MNFETKLNKGDTIYIPSLKKRLCECCKTRLNDYDAGVIPLSIEVIRIYSGKEKLTISYMSQSGVYWFDEDEIGLRFFLVYEDAKRKAEEMKISQEEWERKTK